MGRKIVEAEYDEEEDYDDYDEDDEDEVEEQLMESAAGRVQTNLLDFVSQSGITQPSARSNGGRAADAIRGERGRPGRDKWDSAHIRVLPDEFRESRLEKDEHSPHAPATIAPLTTPEVARKPHPTLRCDAPILRLNYDAWSVIFSFVQNPVVALHCADCSWELRQVIEQSGIFELAWKTVEGLGDGSITSLLLASGLGRASVDEAAQLRHRFPWSAKLSLQFLELRGALLTQVDDIIASHWMEDDPEAMALATERAAHQHNSDLFAACFAELSSMIAAFDMPDRDSSGNGASAEPLPGDDNYDSDVECALNDDGARERLRHFEACAWLELHDTTTHAVAKQFAAIQANRFAGMGNVAYERAMAFDFGAVHPDVAKLIRCPKTPVQIKRFRNKVMLLSLDSIAEREVDVTTLQRVISKVRDYVYQRPPVT